jgi:hypothetical protein
MHPKIKKLTVMAFTIAQRISQMLFRRKEEYILKKYKEHPQNKSNNGRKIM